jgi:hypothetical protein
MIMSKYTTTIKTLIDNNFDFQMTSYPIFDENYRETLNQKILYHYYENEIGFETASLFRFYLNNKLNEIMPYYNQLYNHQIKLLDKLDKNVDLTETFKRDTETNTLSKSNSKSKGKNVFLDTPQGNTYKGDIDSTEYATSVTWNKNDIDDTSDATGTGLENYIKTITGNNGSKYNIEVLKDIKDNIMNIDLMIINELNDLFMGIF